MFYTVVWTPSAEQDLAAAWLASTDRHALTIASHTIEQNLRRAPLTAGESRESSVSRVAFSSPLRVAFDVIVDDGVVFVRAIQLIA